MIRRLSHLQQSGALIVAPLVLLALIGCHGGARNGVSTAFDQAAICPCQAGLRGDLNGSGTPDITDAVGILRIIVGLDPANALGDCDCDGATGITDAIALLRCLVGFDPWPIVCGECVAGQDCVGPDGQALQWVSGGSFAMGSEDAYYEEQPVHQVTLDGFWIGEREVTNDLYAAFLNAAQPADVASWVNITLAGSGIELVGGVYRSKTERGQHPVAYVSWHGAVAYCDQYEYVLPTEARWEYAARGAESLVYPWGNVWDVSKCCNYNNQGPFGRTFVVGSFPAGVSWCGALDMAGNVREWCADWLGVDYYRVSPDLNPPGPAAGTHRVLRGGAWDNMDNFCRASYRASESPGSTLYTDGFRVARNTD